MSKGKPMRKAVTDISLCKGCGLCVVACPKEAITHTSKLNAKGYETIFVNADDCIGCGACYTVCPDYVFEIRNVNQVVR